MVAISELLFPISAVLFDYLINGSVLSAVQWLRRGLLMVLAIIRLNAGAEQRKSAKLD